MSSLFPNILSEFSAATVSPGGPPPPPPPPVSKKKNVREASINAGEYFMAGSSVIYQGTIIMGIRGGLPGNHIHNGKDYGLEYGIVIAQWINKYINHAATAPLQIDDVAVGLVIGHPTYGDIILHLYGEVNHDAVDILHPTLQRYDAATRAKIGSPQILTGGTTGIPQRDYEWGFNNIKNDTDGNPLKKYYFQTKINMVTAPIGERDISFMLTTDGGDTWIERIIEAATTLGLSECDGMHLGGGNYMAFVRIDGGGAWRVWKTTDSWITKSFLGNCTLRCSWGGSYEKIMRFYRNDWNGTWNIKITERDTYWECRSVGNNPIVDGSFTNLANLKQMHLWYYNKSGSHRTIGYGDCQFPAADYSWETVMKEMDTNTECKVMYTEDDNIDTVSAPTPTLFSTFITGSSFAVFIDMDAFTEAQRQNFRLIRFGLYTDPGHTTPASGQYLQSVGVVSIQNIVAPTHFIGFEFLSAGTYYVKIETWNQLGYSPPAYLTQTI
jgi:hypothetical protein